LKQGTFIMATVSTEGNGKPGIAWASRSRELARWAMARLVNRTDVWGGYLPLSERGKTYTKPDGTQGVVPTTVTRPAKNRRGQVVLTEDILARHFAASRPEHVVGLHTTSPENTSKWGATEIDWHGEGCAPDAYRDAALAWYENLVGKGFRPLLTDSNGKGGCHLRVLLAEAVPTPRVFAFFHALVADHAKRGIPKPEVFPKQACIESGRYGNWLRVPGRHHTREHWARVWDGGAWLEGAAAVAFILDLEGSPASLIPDGIDVEHRVRTYMAKLPHLGEKQGRDDVAYNFAAFLVRDLNLPDDVALRWLEEWDAGNRPPKGRERLREIIANVHVYGHRPYGSGLTAGPAPVAVRPQPTPPPTGSVIILDYLRRRYQPVYKKGNAIFSAVEKDLVRKSEACQGAGEDLIQELGNAVDAPRSDGVVKRGSLPKFFRDWAPFAWVEMLNGLREEEAANEIDPSATEQFADLVGSALLKPISLGYVHDNKETRVEQRSLIDWCLLFAKTGNWCSIRSYKVWTCRDPKTDRVRVALSAKLFGQLPSPKLAGISGRKFSDLCRRYEIGHPLGDEERPCGNRAVELEQGFLADLLSAPDNRVDGCRLDPRAREEKQPANRQRVGLTHEDERA
jgi:hypothetical protein